MSRLILSLVFILSFSAASSAAPSVPVEWRISVVMDSETEGNIFFNATIAGGWHLYATETPDGGPIPTSVKINETDGLSFGSLIPDRMPESGVDMVFHLRLQWWAGNIGFRLPFTVNPGTKLSELSGTISFQAGDNSTCISPRHEPFTVTLFTVTSDAAEETAVAAPVRKKTKRTLEPEIVASNDSITQAADRIEKLVGEVQAWKSLSVALMILIVVLIAILFYYIGRYKSQIKK